MAALISAGQRIRSERGAQIIELVVVTPILLLLLGAIVDFGFMFRTWEVVTNAAREGARVGVLPAFSCAAGSVDIETRVNDYLAAAGVGIAADIENDTTTVDGFTACNVTVGLDQPLPSLGVFGLITGGNFTTVRVAGGASMRAEVQAIAP